MAIKKALALYLGKLKEIASGDFLSTAQLGSGTANSTTFLRGDNTWATPSGGPGGSSITETIIDFGTSPINEKSFTITDATCTTSSKIIPFVAGKDQTNENYGMQLNLNYIPAVGSFTLTANAGNELVRGQFIINYLITA